MLPDAELDQLATDIKANGQRNPIIILAGEILDGRNRYRACEIAGVIPITVEFTGDNPLAFVWGNNVYRRHLTASQLAMLADELRDVGQGQRTDLASNDAKFNTKEYVAELTGASTASIDRARTVRTKGTPGLVKAVKDGALSVGRAAEIASLPKEKQDAAMKQPKVPSPSKQPQKPMEWVEWSADPETDDNDDTDDDNKDDTSEDTSEDTAERYWLAARAELDKIPADAKGRSQVLKDIMDYGFRGLPQSDRYDKFPPPDDGCGIAAHMSGVTTQDMKPGKAKDIVSKITTLIEEIPSRDPHFFIAMACVVHTAADRLGSYDVPDKPKCSAAYSDAMTKLATRLLNTVPNENPRFEHSIVSMLWDLGRWVDFFRQKRMKE